jgi:papain like protease
MTVSVVKDLRASFGKARDQGLRPTCMAFAASDTHASVRAGTFAPLSVEYLYYHAVCRSTPPHPGEAVSLESVIEALDSPGQPVESDWPYLSGLPNDLSKWTPPLAVTTFRALVSRTKASSQTAINMLGKGKPAILTMAITESFHQPDRHGIVMSLPVDPVTGYHAVVAVAHGVVGSLRCVLVRNSWGTDWGLQGHAWLHEDYLTANIQSVSTIS